MNRRQKKARLKYLNNIEAIMAERKAEEERVRREAERLRFEEEKRQFLAAQHRMVIQARWDARRRERQSRELNTPKTSTGEW